jgi:hypothetical protein
MSYTKIALLSLLIGCSGSGSNIRPDADVDSPLDADVEADGDVEVEDDADVPLPDGSPPTCDDLSEELELSPEPAHVASIALAADEEGFAVATLEGAGDSQAIVLSRFNADFSIADERLLLAEGRHQATDISLSLGHRGAMISWLEPPDPAACEAGSICRRELFALRVAADEITAGEILHASPGVEVVTRAAHVELAEETLLVGLGRPESTLQLFTLRVGDAATAIGAPTIIIPDQSLRSVPPAAALAADHVIVVAEAAPSGLVGASLSAESGELITGPVAVTTNVSASSPSIAARGSRIGLTFIDSAPSPPGNRLHLAELDVELNLAHDPTLLLDEELLPRSPMIAPAGPGWIITWRDGREDPSADCVISGFCREDIFLIPASLAGAEGRPVRVSVDPNDCRAPRIAQCQGQVALAWLTYRDARRTAFARGIACE